ncbi:MAG: ABC transporter permease [Leptolyngbyaceae cyanobacterium SM1_3_5]|nr:ABC transporter permease [Leptolyngbyaceae cyanobacterium SM1_3_5]
MIDLLLAEWRRNWTQFIRYPIEAIGGILITTIVFYGLFLSAGYIAGSAFQVGDRLDAIVVGYVLWTLVIFIISDISLGLQVEAQTGTLEQVFLSPFGAPRVFLARAIASLGLRLLVIATILLIILGLTGSRLNFPPTLIFPLVSMILAAYGLAFIIGSCALLFKQIQQLLGLFQFVLLFLLATPTETWTGTARLLSRLLPMIPSADLLRDLMAKQAAIDPQNVLIAFANGLAYFAIGLAIFRWAEQRAKQRGLLGGY